MVRSLMFVVNSVFWGAGLALFLHACFFFGFLAARLLAAEGSLVRAHRGDGFFGFMDVVFR